MSKIKATPALSIYDTILEKEWDLNNYFGSTSYSSGVYNNGSRSTFASLQSKMSGLGTFGSTYCSINGSSSTGGWDNYINLSKFRQPGEAETGIYLPLPCFCMDKTSSNVSESLVSVVNTTNSGVIRGQMIFYSNGRVSYKVTPPGSSTYGAETFFNCSNNEKGTIFNRRMFCVLLCGAGGGSSGGSTGVGIPGSGGGGGGSVALLWVYVAPNVQKILNFSVEDLNVGGSAGNSGESYNGAAFDGIKAGGGREGYRGNSSNNPGGTVSGSSASGDSALVFSVAGGYGGGYAGGTGESRGAQSYTYIAQRGNGFNFAWSSSARTGGSPTSNPLGAYAAGGGGASLLSNGFNGSSGHTIGGPAANFGAGAGGAYGGMTYSQSGNIGGPAGLWIF